LMCCTMRAAMKWVSKSSSIHKADKFFGHPSACDSRPWTYFSRDCWSPFLILLYGSPLARTAWVCCTWYRHSSSNVYVSSKTFRIYVRLFEAGIQKRRQPRDENVTLKLWRVQKDDKTLKKVTHHVPLRHMINTYTCIGWSHADH
jgi:hypothetical protein